MQQMMQGLIQGLFSEGNETAARDREKQEQLRLQREKEAREREIARQKEWEQLRGELIGVNSDKLALMGVSSDKLELMGVNSDKLTLMAPGDASFKPTGNRTEIGPASITTTTEQLILSNQLGQQAVQMALTGDLENARYLAELSAQALTGSVTRSRSANPSITLPETSLRPASPVDIQFQRTRLTETHKQIDSLNQNPPNLHAIVVLDQINNTYSNFFQVQSKSPTTSDHPYKQQADPLSTKPVTAEQVCQKWQQKRIKWLAELEQVQKELEATQNQLRKLNQNILSDMKLYSEWEKMVEDGMYNCGDALVRLVKDAFSIYLDPIYQSLQFQKFIAELPGSKLAKYALNINTKISVIEGFQLATTLTDLQELAERENKTSLEIIDTLRDSAGMVMGTYPFTEKTYTKLKFDKKTWQVTPEISEVGNIAATTWAFASDAIDLTYSFMQYWLSSKRIEQFNQNNALHRKALETLTERMKELVDRSRNLKKQLNTSCE